MRAVFRCAAAVLIVVASAHSAAAQSPTQVNLTAGVTRRPVDRGGPMPTAPAPSTAYGAFGPRLFLGVFGASIGFVAGAIIASQTLPRSPCGDDPGLCEAVQGAAVGTVVGAALGAAWPGQGTTCTYAQRAGYGLIGAAAGGLLGLAGDRLGIIFLAATAGGALGAAAGTTRC